MLLPNYFIKIYFFAVNFKQPPNYEIEALAVAYADVPAGVGKQNVSEF